MAHLVPAHGIREQRPGSDDRVEVNERSRPLALGRRANTGASGTMPAAEAPRVTRFNCPNCDAIYDLVRTEAGSIATDRELVCLTCGAPLQSREGRFILKYLLLEPAHRHAGRRRVG